MIADLYVDLWRIAIVVALVTWWARPRVQGLLRIMLGADD